MAAVYQVSNQVYRSHKMVHTLQADTNPERACRSTVTKPMQKTGLERRVAKRFTLVTIQADPRKQPSPNLQQFTSTAPKQQWGADITYLPTAAGWVYLAVVLDLFSRKVVGWDISVSLAMLLVSSALQQATHASRPKPGDLLHHSDRGCQYTSEDYQSTLRTLGITRSMSRAR